ncbi:MAG: hypothetical protein AB1728_04355 [Bacteroidota bacterium]
MKHIVKSFVLFIFSTSLLTSQWWYYPNTYPMEERFEDQSFFFTPTFINPYGVDEFSSELSGIVDHPLMNLQINPAGITSADQHTYLYFDYRTNRDLEREYDYYRGPILMSESVSVFNDIWPYPYYPGTTKLSVEPAFSSAVLGKPFPESMPALTLGVSYELISQSEPFYPIENYGANPYAMDRSMDISYHGVDHVRNTGHFIALFSGYKVTDDLSIGVRIGRSLFDRNGEYGPQVRMTSGSANSSFYSDDNQRSQEYQLWDVSIGAELHVNDHIVVGATAAYSIGDVVQREVYQSAMNTRYSGTTPANSYESQKDNNRNWKHTGNGITLGANSRIVLSSTVTMTTSYIYKKQGRDLSLFARDNDEYKENQRSPTYSYSNGYTSVFNSSGAGDRTLRGHRIAAALTFKTENKLSFSFGIVYNDQSLTTATREYSELEREGYFQNTSQPYTTNRTIENKNFSWSNDRSQNDLQIPFMLDLPLNPYFTMNLGFNRRFLTVEEGELINVEYLKREQYKDGVLQQTDLPMYERYNTPRPSQTANSMSVIAGFTVQPAEGINIRLLAIPYTVNRELNLQWLAGVNILP